jgi:hypothetical protein
MHAKVLALKPLPKPRQNSAKTFSIYLNSLPTKEKVKKRFWRFVMGARKKQLFQDNISKIDTHEGSYVIADCRVFAALPTKKIDFRATACQDRGAFRRNRHRPQNRSPRYRPLWAYLIAVRGI